MAVTAGESAAQWFGHQKSAWDDAPARGANKIVQNFSKKDLGWCIGETLLHQKFGEGVIINIEGSGSNARAQINFGRNGIKLLDLGIAKLEKAA